MNSRGGTLAEGIVAAGISGALYTLSLFLPVGIVAALFSPLPLAWLAWRRPAWQALAFALLAATLPAFIAPVSGIAFLTQFGLGGVLLGEGIKREWRPEVIVGGFTLLSSVAALLILGVMAAMASQTPGELIDSIAVEWREAISRGLGSSEGTPPQETLVALEARLDEVVNFLAHSFFGLSFSVALLTGWANAAWLRRLLRAKGVEVSNWLEWRAPESWIWVLIASAGAMVLGEGMVETIGNNVLFVAVTVYFLQGLAIIQFTLVEKKASPLVRIPLYAVIVLYVPAAPVAVAVMGAFDLWLNFRSRVTPPADMKKTN